MRRGDRGGDGDRGDALLAGVPGGVDRLPRDAGGGAAGGGDGARRAGLRSGGAQGARGLRPRRPGEGVPRAGARARGGGAPDGSRRAGVAVVVPLREAAREGRAAGVRGAVGRAADVPPDPGGERGGAGPGGRPGARAGGGDAPDAPGPRPGLAEARGGDGGEEAGARGPDVRVGVAVADLEGRLDALPRRGAGRPRRALDALARRAGGVAAGVLDAPLEEPRGGGGGDVRAGADGPRARRRLLRPAPATRREVAVGVRLRAHRDGPPDGRVAERAPPRALLLRHDGELDGLPGAGVPLGLRRGLHAGAGAPRPRGGRGAGVPRGVPGEAGPRARLLAARRSGRRGSSWASSRGTR